MCGLNSALDNGEDVPLRRKEQAEKDMSTDFKPKKESRKYLGMHISIFYCTYFDSKTFFDNIILAIF